MAMHVLPKRNIPDCSAPLIEGSKTAAPKRPIAFFVPGLEGGGAQRVFVTLVNTLVTITEHPIHLVTSRDGGVFAGQVDERVVRVVLGPKHVSRSVFRLAGYIRRERPIAMISTLNYCNIIFLTSARIARVPLRKVIREAIVLQDEPASLLGRLRRLILRTLMRTTYRYADDLIIITEDVAHSLLANRIGDVDRMRRIPNPVSPEQLTTCPRVSGLDVTNGKPFILGIGRLSHQKGFDTLIRAFAKLHRTDIDLIILGEGRLQSQLEALAESLGVRERVLFVGFVATPSLYFKQASLFVLSSRWEGFSNVLIEALASGTPIVSTDCPGSPREVLQDGRLGRLVPIGNPGELAGAMQLELELPTADRNERVARADDFAPERIAQRYLNVSLGLPDPPSCHEMDASLAPVRDG